MSASSCTQIANPFLDGPFDPVSRRGQQGTCHIHIKALGNTLFVCARGILSCLLCGSHSIDTAGCHCAYVAWLFQVKLSFDLSWNWEWQRPGSAPGTGPSLLYKAIMVSHNKPCHRHHCANIPTSPQPSVHIDCRLWVHVCACTSCVYACSCKLTFF